MFKLKTAVVQLMVVETRKQREVVGVVFHEST